MRRAQLADKVTPVAVGQPEVHDGDVEGHGELLARLPQGVRLRHYPIPALPLEDVGEGLTDYRVIVDEEDVVHS